MPKAVKVEKEKTEEVKKELKKRDFFDTGYNIKTKNGYSFIPVKDGFSLDYEIVNEDLEKNSEDKTIKKILEDDLPEEKLKYLSTSYEKIGDIMILELEDELEEYKEIIGEGFLEYDKSVNTVVKKASGHKGEYRVRDYEILAGEEKTSTVHSESGLKFKVDINEMYFTSRLSNERLRIADLTEDDENVLVMFSGCAPYCCVIADNSNSRKVIGIEKNPVAHEYAVENIKLNNLENKVSVFEGDVKEVLPTIENDGFDRIIMPLPESSNEFLDLSIDNINVDGVIHYYTFVEEGKEEEEIKKIEEKFSEKDKSFEILDTVEVGQRAPYVSRVCFDIKVNN